MNKFHLISITLLFFSSACENKSKSIEFNHHQDYLKNEINLSTNDLSHNQPIYIINLSSCSGCIELNFNYLKNNCNHLDLELLIVGNYLGTVWQNEIEVLQKCYKIYFDKKSRIKRYNISSSKPLLIQFDENGTIADTKRIQDNEVDQIPTVIGLK